MDETTKPGPSASAAPTLQVGPYLTLDEAAEYARCSTRTLRRWIKADKLPSIKSGRQLVHVDDLNAAMRGIPSGTA